MKLSVIIPCYNEEGNILNMYGKTSRVLENKDYELIFVNDGSKDDTASKLIEIYNEDKEHVRVINFSRNFGKDAAMYAGLTHSTGKYTAIIDADLQQNPRYLLEMIHYLDKNEDIDQIAMVNRKRKENFITRILKWKFYTFINMISDTKFVKGASDFRMFRRTVVDAIGELTENNRFSKGLFSWVGFNTHYMEYNVENRESGKSNFSFFGQWRYAFNGIINFSVKPLRLATFFGGIFALFSLIYLVFILIDTLLYGNPVPGYPTIICAILLLGGLQLMAIGILGEYISRTYIETKKRPVYIAKQKLGFKDDSIL